MLSRKSLTFQRSLATSVRGSQGVKVAAAPTVQTSVPAVESQPGLPVQPFGTVSKLYNTSIKHGTEGRSANGGHVVTVFGCTGFLGHYLVHELARRGNQVIVPYRGSAEDVRDLKVTGDLGQVVPLRVDLRDEESIHDCIKHSDTVYNLVGRRWETRNFSFQQAHVEIPRRLARMCRESSNVQRFIHVSAQNADTKCDKSQFYYSKGRGELAVELENPDAIIVRPADMYGLEGHLLHHLGKVYTHQIRRWFTLGYIPLVNGGKHTLSPVYVNDVARALFALMEHENPKSLYELYGPDQMQYRQVVELFCEYARKPYSPLAVPHELFRKYMEVYQQVNPFHRTCAHDIDRLAVDEKRTEGAGTFADFGIIPKHLDQVALRFVRHWRTSEWVDQPATADEMKYWKRLNF